MKKAGIWSLGAGLGMALLHGLRRARNVRTRPNLDPTALVSQNYMMYVMLPLWVTVGFLDYAWHRRTKIERTSGATESLMHLLMMSEAGLPAVAGLLLDVNAGVLLLMLLGVIAHSATAAWDVAYAVERRKVEPTEQHLHSFMESLPLFALSFMACVHWDQCKTLFGAGDGKPDFAMRLKKPSLPPGYLAFIFRCIAVNAIVYSEELLRCKRAEAQGLTGTETPRAARDLYGDDDFLAKI